MQETIGWIGLGSMGHRMSRHLSNAGHPLLVADAASTERAPKGASIAQTNAEVAVRAATIFLSLPDGAVSQTVARELATAPDRKAKTVIDTSTIGIEAAERCATLLAANGIECIDAPVSGGTSGADKATIAIMLACARSSFERLEPLLRPHGQAVLRRAEAGAGTSRQSAQQFFVRNGACRNQRSHRLRHRARHRHEDHS